MHVEIVVDGVIYHIQSTGTLLGSLEEEDIHYSLDI